MVSAGLYELPNPPPSISLWMGFRTRTNIVRKVVEGLIAARTIQAYGIVARLRKYGAKVHGTENVELLLENTSTIRSCPRAGQETRRRLEQDWQAEICAIALRIQEVMASDGDIGILFIGRAHDVVGKLPDEFTVICL